MARQNKTTGSTGTTRTKDGVTHLRGTSVRKSKAADFVDVIDEVQKEYEVKGHTLLSTDYTNPHGDITSYSLYRNDEDGNLMHIGRNEKGEVLSESYHRNRGNNKLNLPNYYLRENGEPSEIKYYAPGIKKHERWAVGINNYRPEDKPAVIKYYQSATPTDEQVKMQERYVMNELHREGAKPAVINYNEKGLVESEEYWFKGEQYDKDTVPFGTPDNFDDDPEAIDE
jgi:hypothetical protein